MRRFVLGWKKLGHEERLRAYIVNYVDDLVICCRGGAEQALATMRDMMSKLKLTVNETKTRSALCQKRSSTFWDTRLGVATRRGRAALSGHGTV
jgi:RNA-directed DNA polymerase